MKSTFFFPNTDPLAGKMTSKEAAEKIAAAGCSDQIQVSLGIALNPISIGKETYLPISEVQAFIQRFGKKSKAVAEFEAALDKSLGLKSNTNR